MQDIETTKNIMDSINSLNLDQLISFNNEELESLKTLYLNILTQNISKEKYSKQGEALITINDKSIVTDAYTLTLTKEEFNNVFIKILEQVKNDEIILTKIDNLNSQLKQYLSEDEDVNIKEQLLQNIDTLIEKIKNNNIGQEEIKITVYENDGETVRTVINYQETKIVIDKIFYDNKTGFSLLISKNTEDSSEETIVEISKINSNGYYMQLKSSKNGQIMQNIEITITQESNGNNIKNKLQLNIEKEQNQLSLDMQEDINIVNNFSEQVYLDEDNNVELRNLSEEQLNGVMEVLQENVQGQIDKIQANITLEEFYEILQNVGLIKRQDIIDLDNEILTDIQINRFNAQFEFYQGEDVDITKIEELVEAVKQHLQSVMYSSEEIVLNIKMNSEDEDVAEELIEEIKRNETKKYTIKMDYNEENGLLEKIRLIMK